MAVLRRVSAAFRAVPNEKSTVVLTHLRFLEVWTSRYGFCSSATDRIVTELQVLVVLYFYFLFLTLMLVVKRTSIRCRQNYIIAFAVYS